MSEDSLVKRGREARDNYERAYKHFKELQETHRLNYEGREKKLQERHENGDIAAGLELVQLGARQVSELSDAASEVQSAAQEMTTIFAEANIEGAKLMSDALKQQATFSGAAIAAVAGITGVLLPPNQELIGLLGATYFVLILTACISLILLNRAAHRVELMLRTGKVAALSRGEGGWVWEWVFIKAYAVSMFGLPVAVILFVIFVLFNLDLVPEFLSHLG